MEKSLAIRECLANYSDDAMLGKDRERDESDPKRLSPHVARVVCFG